MTDQKTVYAANIVQDVRENIRNLVGGRMNHYERPIWRPKPRSGATTECWG
ncbi:MAG: hypothetical protein HY328_09715 [Chloroflexi bacterium]|nr:hypothetical protein [Chloroflexota bacterium]